MSLHSGIEATVQNLTNSQPGVGIIAVHGRGQNPEYMLAILRRLAWDHLPCIAPAAYENSWYPQRFMVSLADNQPWLAQANEVLATAIDRFNQHGLTQDNLILVGFSQGACLVADFVHKNPGRYRGIVCFTGALPGPEGTQWSTDGSFQQTPLFISTSRIDDWIPVGRVQESAVVFDMMKAAVTVKIYEDRPHEVNDDEIYSVCDIIKVPAQHQ